MASSILDASAFYAGVPFGSMNEYLTTHLVYGEISHIKERYGALGVLLATGRLRICEPDQDSMSAAAEAAKGTGDMPDLSEQDLSVIALAVMTGKGIVTDDFAVSNVARGLGLAVTPVMTGGIRDQGRWMRYCPGCRRSHPGRVACPACGTPLKKKLLKRRGR